MAYEPKMRAEDVLSILLANGSGGGGSITVDTEMSETSEHPVQNKVITAAFAEKDQIDNGIYDGIDLTIKFASEIAASPYNGDAWAWINARITAGNFKGLHVCDYIPFTADSKTYNAQIAGINTYKDYAYPPIGNHIDFICKELWHVNKPINPVNYNNGLIPVENVTSDGTSTTYTLEKEMNGVSSIKIGDVTLEGYTYDASTYTLTFESAPAAGTMVVTGTGTEFPWLACDLYHWLNSLSGQVPNGTTLDPDVKHVDYTTTGVYDKLPSALRAVIVEKRAYIGKRYVKTSILNNSSSVDLTNIGKLWLPTESEVYGHGIFANISYDMAGSTVQYPIFSKNITNRKKYGNGTARAWWLLTPYSGSTTYWCSAYIYGYAYYGATTLTNMYTPICFRIGG